MGVDAIMRIVPNTDLTDEEIRDVSADMVEAFGSEQFIIDRKGEWGKPNHALERTGEVIKIHLMGCYYGPGYERGDPLLYLAIARYIEVKWPSAEVFYGGDSSNTLQPFGPSQREDLWRHFITVGHSPYNSAFGKDAPKVQCEFCDRAYRNYGGGGGNEFMRCDSCGHKIIVDRHGKTLIEVDQYEDFFKASERLRNASKVSADA